jgi:hypothetical protein
MNDVPPSHGPIARAFIGVNRIFGAMAVFMGIVAVADALVGLVRGVSSLRSTFVVGGFGVIVIIVGVLYLKAPLARTRKDG